MNANSTPPDDSLTLTDAERRAQARITLPDDTLTETELLAEVHRLMHRTAGTAPCRREVTWVDGRAVVSCGLHLPAVGSEQWWAAPERLRIASLLPLGRAWLVMDPDRRVAQAFKDTAVAVSGSAPWASLARDHLPHAELMRRRYPPTGDPELWAKYGPDGPPGWSEAA